MRYLNHVDIDAVRDLMVSLVTFHPAIPAGGVNVLFYLHFALVCTLLIYFPMGKLMHAVGVFMSPTRNMVNDSRANVTSTHGTQSSNSTTTAITKTNSVKKWSRLACQSTRPSKKQLQKKQPKKPPSKQSSASECKTKVQSDNPSLWTFFM